MKNGNAWSDLTMMILEGVLCDDRVAEEIYPH